MPFPIFSIWRVERYSILPILEIVGESQDLKAEPYMLQTALELIKKAEEFKGKTYSVEPTNKVQTVITIEFALIFPNDEYANKFTDFIAQFNNRGFML